MAIEALIKAARQGNKDALVQLIMAQQQDYYKLAFVYMKNKEDALDAMEDMIVILYENIHRLKNENVFYSWSKTILVNCCKNHIKKSKKVVSLEAVQKHLQTDICEPGFQEKETQIMLESHLSHLNEKHREVLKLRYYLDYDYQTIAALLKIPVGTVKSRISIGLDKLKTHMGGDVW